MAIRNYTYNIVPSLDADLSIECISRATARTLRMPDSAAGANIWAGAYQTGTGTYAGSVKRVYSIPGYVTYLIWDSTTSTWSDTKWKNVSAHEHGHGLGYSGHNIYSSTQLMYPVAGTVTLPQTYDKRHMRNLYLID